MTKKRVAFATGSRADYGIVRRYLSLMNKDENIDLQLLVTGAWLDDEYGRQVDLIYADGFKVAAEIKLPLATKNNAGILGAMAVALEQFGIFFEKNKFDLLIILGDRYEMLSVATAASIQRIPILHLHGGELTYGNYDEFIRHSITKMSKYHFTSTEEYRQRVIQLGEQRERVFYLGALGAENCMQIDENSVPAEIAKLPKKEYFVVLFHPETLTDVSLLDQVNSLLEAIENFYQYTFVFLGTNADTHADVIRDRVKQFVSDHKNTLYFENIQANAFQAMLKNAICLIGNSSSGMIEAPSLGIYTVNIGARQDGRIRANSVVDTKCEVSEITKAVEFVLANYQRVAPVNPYYRPHTAENYYKTTLEILRGDTLNDIKMFYDLPRNQRTLVVLTSPYILSQMLWFKSVDKTDDEWDVVVLKHGSEENQLKTAEQCRQSGVFDNVWIENRTLIEDSLIKQGMHFACLFFNCLFGRKKHFCKKYINHIVGDVDKYDRFLICHDFNLLSGCIMNLSEVGKIYLFEDGLLDYLDVHRKPKCSITSIACWLISKMGYMNYYDMKTKKFPFKLDKKCIKFATFPGKLAYRDYYGIKPLFEYESEAQREKYAALSKATFTPNIELDFEGAEVVYFTEPFYNPFTKLDDVCQAYEQVHAYLKENFSDKKIFIKKHPRDYFDYDWNDLDLVIKYENVPAELFLSIMKTENVEKLIICNFSTFLLSCIKQGVDSTVLRVRNPLTGVYDPRIQEQFERFGIDESMLVEI